MTAEGKKKARWDEVSIVPGGKESLQRQWLLKSGYIFSWGLEEKKGTTWKGGTLWLVERGSRKNREKL